MSSPSPTRSIKPSTVDSISIAQSSAPVDQSFVPRDQTQQDPHWLTESQQCTWRRYLLGAARMMEYLDDDLRSFGLDVAEYEILVCLEEVPDRQLRMSELADRVHQSRSRLTHTVARMEKDGYVERRTCPTDRRGVWAQLTDEGYALLSAAAPQHAAAVRRAFVDVVDPADLEAVGRAFGAVLEASENWRTRPQSRASA